MNKWLQEQYKNAFLWVPFIMAGGAAMYFACANTTCAVASVAAGAVIITGALCKNKYAMRGGMLFLFGLSYATLYTHIIATPRIYHPMRDIELSGRVHNIDFTPDKTRLYISVPANQVKSTAHGAATLRLNVADATNIHIGDNITATASIFPPAMASAPETFDYARWSYFNGLTATGFISDYTITSHSNGGMIDMLRNRLHEHGNSFLADTLVLGYKNAIPRDQGAVWTAAGVGHVWSISGFHMTLVSGWLFAIFFCVFRMIPYVTRRVPARIPALICAWTGLLFYLFLSGADVATIRAFLMTTLVFAAFIMGRSALSMRNICIVFCAIFLIKPHYIMQPGFQLSFAAIFGLIWFWGGRRTYNRTIVRKIGFAIYAAAMTSVVATIFTAPFVAAHFYQVPTYGLIGNLILLPVFSFVIMPAVVVGTITAAAGLTGPLSLAEYVYAHLLPVAQKISDMPYANIITPHIPNIALVMIITGFLCVMFLRATDAVRRLNYIIGEVFIATGVLITATYPRPVFYAAPDHVLVAFSYNGKLEFNKSRSSAHLFTFDTWKQLNHEPVGTPNTRCKGQNGVWMYDAGKFNLAYIQKFVPLQREIVRLCHDNSVNYIVSYFDIRAPKCSHKILRGGFVIYPDGRVRYSAPMRPWNSPRP